MSVAGQGGSTKSNANTFQFQLIGPQREIARDVARPLAQGGLEAFQGAAGLQEAQSPLLQDLISQLTAQFGQDFGELGARTEADAELRAQQGALAEGVTGLLGNFGQLRPGEQELIQAQQEAQFAAGAGLIQRGAGQGLEQLRDVLAPSQGLRSTDTPILDRGGLIQREALFQQGQLANQLAAQAANQSLQIPLQRDIASAGIAGQQQGLLGQQQALSAGLATSNLQSRLGLLGQGGAQGLGLASIPNVAGLLQGVRPSQGSQSESSSINVGLSGGFLAPSPGGD